ALEAARLRPPDVILSDVLMPRMDGFRLCLAVRKDARLSRIPVVLQSSKFTDAADEALAFKVGANTFVARAPDSAEAMEAVLNSLTAQGVPPFEDVIEHGYSEYLDRI